MLQVAGLEEALELPILNDLVMVLGSLSQVSSSYRSLPRMQRNSSPSSNTRYFDDNPN